jgi:competence protein ComEC
MQRYVFHISIVSFLCGIALCTVVPVSLYVCLWALIIGIGLFVLCVRNREATSRSYVLLTSVIICFFVIGLIRMQLVTSNLHQSSLESKLGQSVELEGVVTEDPERQEKTLNLYVKTGADTILVTVNPYSNIAYGDIIHVSGTLEAPQAFSTDTGREFDYPHYLLARGVEYKISYAHVTVRNPQQGNSVVSFLLRQKHHLMSGIELSLLEPQAGLGEGLLLGVKQALRKELNDAFRKAGIIHIVVLSGYNIMLIVAFTMYCLSLFFSRRISIVVGLVMVVCFALIVGLSATVVRASIMAALFLSAQALGRTYDITRSLLFAGAVMIFLNPFLLLYDIGFQLSFVATLGLILIAPKLEALFKKQSILGSVREYLVATTATQIAVLPLLLYSMGQVSLVAVVVNILVLPIVPLAMLSTFITGVIALFYSPLAVPFAFIAHLSLSYIVLMATWFAALPFSAVTVSYFPLSFFFGLYGIIIGGVWWLWREPKEPDTLAGWVIEEEIEKVGEVLCASPTQSLPPIFFR